MFKSLMFKMLSALLQFSILSLLSQVSNSKVVQGYIRTGENWAYMTRFCFLSRHGRFKYELSYTTDLGTQNIDLYYDTPTQWERVYGKHASMKTCAEKESVLQVTSFFEKRSMTCIMYGLYCSKVENNQFINLTASIPSSGCKLHKADITGALEVIRCESMRNFNTARERWWFVALSNCNSTNGLHMG